MGSAKKLIAMVTVGLLAVPQPAFADSATTQAVVIPSWLALGVGIAGMLIAIGLMVDAVLLRRVSEGSMIAENIVYMMLAVLCFAASMLARFVLLLDQFAEVTDLVTLAADLLMTAGMALLTAYFYRVRKAMTRYMDSARAYQDSVVAHDEGDTGA